jgi:outer membrane protein TolC
MVLDADVARATAFRAQAEAGEATAKQQLASATAALALLSGDDVAGADLTTPLTTVAVPANPSVISPDDRADLQSSRLRAEAAREMAGHVSFHCPAREAPETQPLPSHGTGAAFSDRGT